MARITTAPSLSQNRKVIYGHGFHSPIRCFRRSRGVYGHNQHPFPSQKRDVLYGHGPPAPLPFHRRERGYMGMTATSPFWEGTGC